MERLFSSHTNTFQEGMKLITIKLWLVSFLLGTLRFVKRVNIPRQNETNLLFSSLLKSCVLTLVSFPLETREYASLTWQRIKTNKTIKRAFSCCWHFCATSKGRQETLKLFYSKWCLHAWATFENSLMNCRQRRLVSNSGLEIGPGFGK